MTVMRRALSLVGTVLLLIFMTALMAVPSAQAMNGSFLSLQAQGPNETVLQPSEATEPITPAPQPEPVPTETQSVEPAPTTSPPSQEQPPPAQQQPPAVRYDPVTGFQIDPGTGYLIHPGTGYLIEPGSGRLLVYAVDGSLVGTGFVWDANTGLVSEEVPEEPSETPSPEPTPTQTASPTPTVSPTASPTLSPTPVPQAENSSNAASTGNQLVMRVLLIAALVGFGTWYFFRMKRVKETPMAVEDSSEKQ